MLLKKLKNQVTIALIQFLLMIASAIFGAFLIVFSIKFTNKNGVLDFHIISTNSTIFLTWMLRILSLLFIFIWIMGIINSFQINGITHDSILLIVMAIITLLFGHLWVACYQLKKHKNAAFEII